jgi:2-keto-4-pentenoate hydratase/2-oxohepta-3-ene-1,7-dioic acid hydratase in catechol pathway
MRMANVAGRAKLLLDDRTALDVAAASDGRFGPEPAQVYENWDDFRAWAAGVAGTGAAGTSAESFDPASAGPPSPTPRQVFAVALNYREHAAESGVRPPDDPLFFTKFVSAFSGPVSEVVLPGGHVDWECELVAVIGRTARRVDPAHGWDHVAGVTVGQDISERVLQRSGPVPQFSLGKSHSGFAPSGPVLVTADELDDPDDLAIGCTLDGEVMQDARTSQMIFPVAHLVSYLSHVVTLLPGDVIFTGTPPGVGMGRSPQRWIQPGETLVSRIEGIGEMRQTFVASPG